MLEKLIAAFLALFRRSPIAAEDVWSELEARAARHGENLAPRTSIVDLLKALDMDSSLSARRVLWQDMGNGELYHGSAEQNIELHRAIVAKVAARGIKL